MTEMSQHSNACPKCGAHLPVEATAGLCPRCLMEGALAQTMPDTLPMANRERPSPAELAPHFPHLDILEYLGRGGMGVVYKARQKSLNRLVALKLLAPERVVDDRFAKRFAKEAQALAALNHPNIVTIYDFGQAGGYFYLLMEFVDGVNLRQAMRAARFTPEEALAIVPPICGALQYAHEHGVVHRDIKPENLLLDKEGHVKIADFGIAKMLNAAPTDVGVTESLQAGTPQYMAPEQMESRRTDHRADIYSLGVLLYELLTGELPGKPLTLPSKKVVVDVRLDEIVLRALEEDPERRYQTVAEIKTLVETVSSTTEAQRQSLTTAAHRRHLFTRIGSAALIMLGIAATWTALNGIGRTAHSHKEGKQDMNTNTSAAILASLLAVTSCVETTQTKAGAKSLPIAVLADPSQLQYANLEVKRVSNGDSLGAGAYKYIPDNRAHSMLLELQPVDLSKASELRFEVKKDEAYGRIKITLRDFGNLISRSIDVTPYISGAKNGYQVIRIPAEAFKTQGWDMRSVKLLFIGDQTKRDKDGPSFSVRAIEAGFLHNRIAEKKDVRSDENLTEPERKAVTLTKPYPTADKDAATDKIAVQYAVIELGKQAGLGYKWDESFKNTDPICRKWVNPDIMNKPFRAAMQELLDPVGLTYEVRGNEIVLKKK